MTIPISAISGISGLSGISGISGVDALKGTDALSGAAASAGAGQGPNANFGDMLTKGLESVQASQNRADDLAVQVADGTLKDPAQYTMAANEASLGLQLTLAIRNKAVEAFQEIMRMQA
ncbi:flagellar hook-basal body complex protein FliE [Actinoplanes sp. KI2]|uniref:flagellar hook-basal body complex protein FliE n=1 Tax=Actinoplanes sp. KI2 TaxID=2983315 RepID=UPI0021D5943D|nr:flagellar hook-basal body complex protein FliE [Actinoplanes sp. KI2]MCU7731184.1 flagellar hook-basal body complex protein FliE [Actinoplanes sp. KI2]